MQFVTQFSPQGIAKAFLISILALLFAGCSDQGLQNEPPEIAAFPTLSILENRNFSFAPTITDSVDGIRSVSWRQLSGPEVELEPGTRLQFVAPEVGQNEVLEFEVEAKDTFNGVSTAVAVVNVVNLTPPSIRSATGLNVDENRSFRFQPEITDPDDVIRTTEWTIIDGSGLVLEDGNQLRFVAPEVNQDTTLVFEVTVSDGVAISVSERFNVVINDLTPPTLQSFTELRVLENRTVTFPATIDDILSNPDQIGLDIGWQQLSGMPLVDLADDDQLRFIAPSVAQETPLQFRISLSDGFNISAEQILNVVVVPIEISVADLPGALSVREGENFQFDPRPLVSVTDDINVSFSWSQTAGSTVELIQGAPLRFTAPALEEDSALTFELTITEATGEFVRLPLAVTVVADLPPSIEAFEPQEVFERQSFSFIATVNDDDGSIDSTQWTQILGPELDITGDLAFTAPSVEQQTELQFELTVTDSDGLAATSILSVMVQPFAELDTISLSDDVLASCYQRMVNNHRKKVLQGAEQAWRDAGDIGSLDCLGYSVGSLEGLENLQGLVSLLVGEESVGDELEAPARSALSDLTPLSSLPLLRTLVIHSTQVVDLSPLNSISTLNTLHLANVAPEVFDSFDNIGQLAFLHLINIPIEDGTFLTELTNLESIRLIGNGLIDLQFLSAAQQLEALRLEDNRDISEFQGLENLQNLTVFRVSDTGVSDIAVVENYTALEEVKLFNNSQLSSIEDLAGLTALTTLSLGGLPLLSDLAALENSALTALALDKVGTYNLDFSSLPLLQELAINSDDDSLPLDNLAGSGVDKLALSTRHSDGINVTDLASKVTLKELTLDAPIDRLSLEGVQNMPSLTSLEIASSGAGTIVGLARVYQLVNLKRLVISTRSGVDLSDLSASPISQLSLQITDAGAMTLSSIQGSAVTDLTVNAPQLTVDSGLWSPLSSLDQLNSLSLVFEYQAGDGTCAFLSALEASLPNTLVHHPAFFDQCLD